MPLEFSVVVLPFLLHLSGEVVVRQITMSLVVRFYAKSLCKHIALGLLGLTPINGSTCWLYTFGYPILDLRIN